MNKLMILALILIPSFVKAQQNITAYSIVSKEDSAFCYYTIFIQNNTTDSVLQLRFSKEYKFNSDEYEEVYKQWNVSSDYIFKKDDSLVVGLFKDDEYLPSGDIVFHRIPEYIKSVLIHPHVCIVGKIKMKKAQQEIPNLFLIIHYDFIKGKINKKDTLKRQLNYSTYPMRFGGYFFKVNLGPVSSRW